MTEMQHHGGQCGWGMVGKVRGERSLTGTPLWALGSIMVLMKVR